jgi:RNA polymerase sigma-70 factor (ECF subfamily)
MSKPGDQDTIIQLQQGSLEALGQLYDQYRQMVYRTALAITADPEAANDLLQDVFLRLFRFADRIDPTLPLEPWLYRMTANLANTWLRRNRRWLRPLEDLADWLAGSSKNSPDDQVEQDDEWRQVQTALAHLPLQQRVVVAFYYLNDLSLQEISEILDVPVGTIKSRLHYGRRALKQRLGLKVGLKGEKLPDFTYEQP